MYNVEEIDEVRIRYARVVNDLIANKEFLKRDETSKSFVLAINSPWGTGKSTFLEHFIASNQQYEFITYDAWKCDFWDKPYESFFSCLFESNIFTNYQWKENEKDLKTLGSFALNFGLDVVSSLIPFGASVKEIFNKGKELYGELKNNHEPLFRSYKEYEKQIEEFKNVIAKIINNSKKKVIIAVDELDRCKPDFAISFLEMIKHFFNIEDLTFVLLLDMDKLSCTVNKIYGDQFDGRRYLNRFFDYQTELPKNDSKVYVEKQIKLISNGEFNKLFEKLNKCLDSGGYSIREMQLFFNHYKNVYKSILLLSGNYATHEFYLVYTLLKILQPTIFGLIKNRVLPINEILANNVIKNNFNVYKDLNKIIGILYTNSDLISNLKEIETRYLRQQNLFDTSIEMFSFSYVPDNLITEVSNKHPNDNVYQICDNILILAEETNKVQTKN